MKNEAASDLEISEMNRTLFVIEALKLLTPQLQTSNKNEIINLICPQLPYIYLRNLQIKINSNFIIPPVDNTYKNYTAILETIKQINKSSNIFKKKQDHDFDIFSDMIMLIIAGARFLDGHMITFDSIRFLCNDGKFRKNITDFSGYLNNSTTKKTHEKTIENTITQIDTPKPYP